MKLASFKVNNAIHYGLVRENKVLPVSADFQAQYPSLRHVLVQRALTSLAQNVKTQRISYELNDLEFLPPLYNAERIFCVGMNYPKNYPLDDDPPPPGNPVLFTRVSGTLVGHNQPLDIPSGEAAKSFDYEGEIVVVISKQGRHIKKEDANDYIAGYTIMNEGSVRAWQKHSVHAGKNFANSGSCGPYLVTKDEIKDLKDLSLTTRLNGHEVQNCTANQMIFSVEEIIAYLSHTIDLRAGDLIATGSPEGTGASQNPVRFLRQGDCIEVEVSGLGVLRNRVA